MNKFYLTSAIPYVNAKPHIGHALEFIQADTISRFHHLIGDQTFFLCGADENAIKNVQAAEKAGVPVQEFVDKNSSAFEEVAKKLHVQFDVWQKGSSPAHHNASQKLWELCEKHGDIYKKEYSGLYCVGCELFYTRDELDENGECYEHPGKKLEEVTETNYFFRLSMYKQQLIELLRSNTLEVVPEHRKNEVLSFLSGDLQDISISRSNERAKNWGVPVPGDDTQRMYVWFDALNIYQSGVGFGSDDREYHQWWPADLHVIGKGIIRFHAVYWPAFLLSAGLKLPKKLFVHDYITVNGQKMSKTLGNVIDPIDLVNKFGADPLRYYFLRYISPFTDGDFSEEKFVQAYNADLANGLGNLVARIAKLSEKAGVGDISQEKTLDEEYKEVLTAYKFNDALEIIWKKIRSLDQTINEREPWKITDEEALQKFLTEAAKQILVVAYHLRPFLPVVAEKIEQQFTSEKIASQPPLFPRLNAL